MPNHDYVLWKCPTDRMPETSGRGVTIIPGFGNWVLLHSGSYALPHGQCIPVSEIVNFLESYKDA